MSGEGTCLAVKVGVQCTDEDGRPILFKATSWRAGYVESALAAGLTEPQVRATGRWASRVGMMAYNIKSDVAFQRAADAIGAHLARPSLSASSVVVGQSSSEAVFDRRAPLQGGFRSGPVRYVK